MVPIGSDERRCQAARSHWHGGAKLRDPGRLVSAINPRSEFHLDCSQATPPLGEGPEALGLEVGLGVDEEVGVERVGDGHKLVDQFGIAADLKV